MACFIGEFITKFLGKEEMFKNCRDVKVYILNKLKKIQDSKNISDPTYHNKVELICNILFETNNGNKRLQEIKSRIIIELLMDRKVDIESEEKKIISALDKSIFILRKKIIQIIKEHLNGQSIDENVLNEKIFYNLLDKEQKIILKFISKYNIKKIKDKNNVFNAILFEYKSLDFKALMSLYNYILEFNEYYKIYNLFIELINYFEKNKESNKINLYHLYKLMDDNIYYISSGFTQLNKKLEIMNKEIQNMKMNYDSKIQKLKRDNEQMKDDLNIKLNYDLIYQKLKKDNEKMKLNYDSEIKQLKRDNAKIKSDCEQLKKDNKKQKVENNKLREKINELKHDINEGKFEIGKLKNKLDRISENLQCPISKRIIDVPVITPYGITYEKDKILMWLISSNTDPVIRKHLSPDQLITNLALKNVIEEFKKK